MRLEDLAIGREPPGLQSGRRTYSRPGWGGSLGEVSGG